MSGRQWQLRQVDDGHLTRVTFAGRATIGTQPGFATAWIGADLALHDGTLDDLQHGQDHVAVVARAWTLHDGHLTDARSGIWCWDRSVAGAPTPCAPGQDWRYDVGARGGLPRLLPARRAHPAGRAGVTTSDGYTWTLHSAHPTGPVESGNYDLVATGHGTSETVAVPPSWRPVMFRAPARVGDLTDGVLLSQEGGDSDTWRVYVRWAGHVQQLQTRGPVALGGGFTADGGTAYLSWTTADGSLYTRVGTPRPGHYRVYAWTPTGATASTAPVLEARDLGIVCLDETLGTYGICAD